MRHQVFKQIVKENTVHKSTNKHRQDEKDPIITSDRSLVNSPLEIKGSEFVIEAQLSSVRVRVYSKQLLDLYNVTQRCSYTIYFKS